MADKHPSRRRRKRLLTSTTLQVYSCEYQSLAVTFLTYCPAVDIPFFPAPADAPGGCSCNLGDVFYDVNNFSNATCANEPTLDTDKTLACTCCEESAALTP
jgi:hypothetical protein